MARGQKKADTRSKDEIQGLGAGKGFGLELMDQIQNEGTVHHKLVDEIERTRKRNFICYASFFQHPAGTIMDIDATLIENILKSIDLDRYDRNLDLLLHSPGGSPLSAEKVILTCRSYSESFRVIVPKTAMSAATLIAMGADEIVMSDTSEIGPIDPQMIMTTRDGQIMRPAAAFIDAYLELIHNAQDAILNNKPPHPFLELLRGMDPSWIQTCLKARDLSRTIAKEYLKKYMLSQKTDEEISHTVEKFMRVGEELSHGRVIRAEKAQEYGLKIELIDKASDLWNRIWELFMRFENYVQAKNLAKYFICRQGGINVQAQRLSF